MNTPTPHPTRSTPLHPRPSATMLPTPTHSSTEQFQHLRQDIERQIANKEQELGQCVSGIQKNVITRQLGQLRDRLIELDQFHDIPPATLEKLRHLERDLVSYRGQQQRKDKPFHGRGLDVLPSPSTSTLAVPTSTTSSLLPLPPPPSGSTPTKRRSKVPNQDRRNNDIEFATEIGQGLLLEVRKMQALLQEKEEQLRALEIQKADLERSAEAMAKQLRQREENEERLKEETWNLELTKQELTLSVTELQQHLQKATSEHTKLTKQTSDLQTDIDQLRIKEEKLTSLLESSKARHEQDMTALRRHCATLQRESQQHVKKIESLTSELTIAKAQSRLGKHANGASLDNSISSSDKDVDPNLVNFSDTHPSHPDFGPSSSTASIATGPSPTFSVSSSARAQAMEVESLKTSLAHAHRMVSNLRSHLHKEKTEKFEFKKLLADSQETIEHLRNDPHLWVDDLKSSSSTPTGVSAEDARRRKPKQHRRRRQGSRLAAAALGASRSLDRAERTNKQPGEDGDEDLYSDDDGDSGSSYSSYASSSEEQGMGLDLGPQGGFTSLSLELSQSGARQPPMPSTPMDAQIMTDPVFVVDDLAIYEQQISLLHQLEAQDRARLAKSYHDAATEPLADILVLEDPDHYRRQLNRLQELEDAEQIRANKQGKHACIGTSDHDDVNAHQLILDDRRVYDQQLHHLDQLRDWHSQHQSKISVDASTDADTDLILMLPDVHQQQVAELLSLREDVAVRSTKLAQALNKSTEIESPMVVLDMHEHHQQMQDLRALQSWKATIEAKRSQAIDMATDADADIVLINDKAQHLRDCQDLHQLRAWHADVQAKVSVHAGVNANTDVTVIDQQEHDQQLQHYQQLKQWHQTHTSKVSTDAGVHTQDDDMIILDNRSAYEQQVKSHQQLQQWHLAHTSKHAADASTETSSKITNVLILENPDEHDQQLMELQQLQQWHLAQTAKVSVDAATEPSSEELGLVWQQRDQHDDQIAKLATLSSWHAEQLAKQVVDSQVMTDTIAIIEDVAAHNQQLARLTELEQMQRTLDAKQQQAVDTGTGTNDVLIVNDRAQHEQDARDLIELRDWHHTVTNKQSAQSSTMTEPVLIVDDTLEHEQNVRDLQRLKEWHHEVSSKQAAQSSTMTEPVLIVDDTMHHKQQMQQLAELQQWHQEAIGKESSQMATMTEPVLIVNDTAQYEQDARDLQQLKNWHNESTNKQSAQNSTMTDPVLIVNDTTQHEQDIRDLNQLKNWHRAISNKEIIQSSTMTEPIHLLESTEFAHFERLQQWHRNAKDSPATWQQVDLGSSAISQPPLASRDGDCQTDIIHANEMNLQTLPSSSYQSTQLEVQVVPANERSIATPVQFKPVQGQAPSASEPSQAIPTWVSPTIADQISPVRNSASIDDEAATMATSPVSTSQDMAGEHALLRHQASFGSTSVNSTPHVEMIPSFHVTPTEAPVNSAASIASSIHDENVTTFSNQQLDPAIASITQTMIGEWLIKYTRKPMQQGFSERCHQRYFWIHPYTRTLYWCQRAPGADGGELKAKSAFVENITVLPPMEHDDMPTILIHTTTRQLKIMAPNKERHALWLESLNYLMSRQNPAPPTPRQQDWAPSLRPQRSFSASLLGKKPSIQRLDQLFRPSTSSTQRTETDIDHHSHLHDDDDDDEALENVRLCCNGKHDVGRLEKAHTHRPAYHLRHHKKTPLVPSH
ncbi:hypothetical protein DM01DRAFT_1086309 [Hesseltinella vesiculosa]|uniref:PH domain-containing protein n=1 Tax=Hesseltinella vesiculosa TaxID=101127 RepID=A0A1X2GDB5_9FUNG|nr:hypothetical protein DM01DRAFT_1086309 [Hesseltinella vesiculosa]